MTDSRFKFLIVLLVLGIPFIYADAQNSIADWNDKTDVFTSPKYNLRWELSDMGEWKVAEGYRLPEPMIFCARLVEDPIVVSLCVTDCPPNADSLILEDNNDFVKGFLSRMEDIEKIFPGIKGSSNIVQEKCKFMFKNAIRFGTMVSVNDERYGTDTDSIFLYAGYLFINNKKAIIPLLLLPYSFVDAYGDDIVNIFFERLSYINASKEIESKK